ncbi:hypothetical protein MUU72_14485 [Streptomyces sp. RS10V-4]|uniref:hypothetical protein n=1 Tax=Streptomyces rhizoryzae TaxID=2932493 RepID=UPI002002D4D7|nr:hypothetical protein [Streptomyces rhizoryzae]MCK7624294.1 hypothetical protein [Streptomyces rhizoryzae]
MTHATGPGGPGAALLGAWRRACHAWIRACTVADAHARSPLAPAQDTALTAARLALADGGAGEARSTP